MTRKIGKDAVCNRDMKMIEKERERLLLILIVLEKKREGRTTKQDSEIITSIKKKTLLIFFLLEKTLNANAYRVAYKYIHFLKSLLIIKQYSILMRVHSDRIRSGMMNKCGIRKHERNQIVQ
jgi:hypothetical protein